MAHKELYKELQKRMRQFRSEDETADFMAHDAAMCRRADTMAAQRAAREKLIAERRAADRRAITAAEDAAYEALFSAINKNEKNEKNDKIKDTAKTT